MATLDWVTLTEAKTVLRLTSTTANDTELTALITAVSQRLDQAVGPVVIRTVTAETYDGAWQPMLQLNYWPVAAITTVVETTAVGASTTLTSAQYLCDYEKGQLWRRTGNWDYGWYIGRENVAVTYTAGRFADTASVDGWWKQGAYMVLQQMWRSRQWAAPGVAPTGDFQVPQVAYPAMSFPKAVVEWFGKEWREKDRGGFA